MIKPENPCFGCHVHKNRQEIKAPCCNDSIILVNSEEYLRLFLYSYLAQFIEVEERLIDGEMYFYIYLIGACPHLSSEGLCIIEETKPLGCKDAQPGEFKYCILPKK